MSKLIIILFFSSFLIFSFSGCGKKSSLTLPNEVNSEKLD